jgi:dTDP-4-dehydrorhamnose 3,5-epimerase
MPVSHENLDLPGVVIISARRFGDARGFFMETYNENDFRQIGIAARFVQDNHSMSAERGTVRGLHFQTPPHAQDKLLRVIRGSVLDVVVDLRKDSSSYGRHIAIELSAENGKQIFVPKGFAHGFCTLEENTEVLYKVSDFYNPQAEAGLLWNDPRLNIPWPTFAGSKLSDKDKTYPVLADLISPFA